MANIQFYLNLAEIVGKRKISLPAKNIKELLEKLVEKYPQLKDELFEDFERHKLNPVVNIFVNGRNIYNLEGLETPLEDNDTIGIFNAMGGG